MTLISKALTKNELEKMTTGCINVRYQTNEGFEIIDMRPLCDRIMNPIEGRGVIRHFSSTHFVITHSKLVSLRDTCRVSES